MMLADAVEQWARVNRSRLEEAEKDRLRMIWRLLRNDEIGSVPVHDMTVDDASRAMSLFDVAMSHEIALVLNDIVQWARTRPREDRVGTSEVTPRPATDRPRPRPRPRETESAVPVREQVRVQEASIEATLFLAPSTAPAASATTSL